MKQNKEYIQFKDITLYTCLGPPGGGRNNITPRIVRHFNILSYTEMTDEVILSIYSRVVSHFLVRFEEQVKESITPLIAASLELYNSAK